MPKHKLVRIVWKDHSKHTVAKWRDFEETTSLTNVDCVSIGFVVKETSEYYIIVQTVTADGLYLNDMMILKGCVVSVRILSHK